MTETLRTAARAAAGFAARAARGWRLAAAVLAAGACSPAPAAEDAQDLQGANASGYVYTHRIHLYDIEGKRIGLDDDPLLPFSTRHTCGRCHDYDTIAGGWHFNAPDPKVAPGRAGQPWLLVDRRTGTQLVLSYRRWPGTRPPGDVGVTPWRFVQLFGRHMPGGGPGETSASRPADPKARWAVSGRLEINCLACHSADRGDDMNEWYVQIGAGNLMWAPAGMSSLATVRGSAGKMPLTYDPFLEPDSDDRPSAPRVYYDPARFDPMGRAFFDVVRRPEPARCLFCHSNAAVGPGAPAKWQTDPDVHLAAGLTCTDCHRNDLGHAIARGDEAPAEGAGGSGATLSCRGCHLGAESARVPGSRGGRLGAPVPRHAGLPLLHLDKLSCTACHSGPWPGARAGRVQTSRAHALEFHGLHRGENAPPEILWPVFVRDGEGKIEPRKMVFPSFFGRWAGQTLAPILPGDLPPAAHAILQEGEPDRPLTSGLIARALAALGGDGGQAVYVAGGRVYRLDGGKLAFREHPAAGPCSWAVAHDVRPAEWSLGAGGRCDDCHDPAGAMLFGKVCCVVPGRGGPETLERAMHELEGLDGLYQRWFGWSWVFRPWLKLVGFAASGVMLVALLLWGLLPGPPGRRAAGAAGRWDKLVYLAALALAAVLAATGFYPVLAGQTVGGWLLMIHVTFGGAFAAAMAVATVTWAGRCRRGRRGGFDPVRKAIFWAVVAAGLVTVLTTMLSMVELFSPEELELLRLVHRYGALALVFLVVADLVRALLARRSAGRSSHAS